MSIFFANITSNGVNVPDESTLVLKHFGGTITLTFQSPDHMNEVGAAIWEASSASSVPSQVVNDTALLAIEDSSSNKASSNQEVALAGVDTTENEEYSSGSESEGEATSRNEDPDSSFESYNGYGLTQEIDF